MSLRDNKKTKDNQELRLEAAIYTEQLVQGMADVSLRDSSYNNTPPSTLMGLAIMVVALGYNFQESSLLIISMRYESKQITLMYMFPHYKVV
jgi:hypothetical protein